VVPARSLRHAASSQLSLLILRNPIVSPRAQENNRALGESTPGGGVMRSLGLTAVTIGLAIAGLAAQGHNHASRASAELESTKEAPAVISPAATGKFTAVIDENAQTIQYQLRFDGLEAPVTQSHIHIAQPDVSGAIVVWLCQTPTAPDPVNTQTQQCPVNGG